jgi:putative two-component system response regulator
MLDIEMPGLDGYETLEIIRSNPETADIPVILLVDRTHLENVRLDRSFGATDYLVKPFSQAIVLKRVEVHLQIRAQKEELRKLSSKLLIKMNERTNDIVALQNAIIMWAAEVIEFRDQETGQHVEHVQNYLSLLLNAMKESNSYADEIAEWDIDALIKSALLHDVGKIKIRDDILLKQTPLTDEEFNTMKLHSSYGKTLLESLQSKVPNQMFLEYAKLLAYRHHEQWDGNGYPDKLKGEEIPLQARMMALADVYDALISERPYKKAFTHDEAMRIIAEGRGTRFDPNLADLFMSISEDIREINEGNHTADSMIGTKLMVEESMDEDMELLRKLNEPTITNMNRPGMAQVGCKEPLDSVSV